MVFLVPETHRPLCLRRGVDEHFQAVQRQGVEISAGGNKVEPRDFVIGLLDVKPFDQEAFYLGGDLRREAPRLFQPFRQVDEARAEIGFVRGFIAVQDCAEHDDFSRAENVGGQPENAPPVDPEAEVGFFLGGKSPDGGAVESKVVPRVQEVLLVVIEHVEAPLDIGEAERYRFQAFLAFKVRAVFFFKRRWRQGLGRLSRLQVHGL